MAALHDAHRGSHPGADRRLHRTLIPETDDNLSLNAHSRHHVAEFPVSVSGLVLIHEIHVNGVIGNLLIKLRM